MPFCYRNQQFLWPFSLPLHQHILFHIFTHRTLTSIVERQTKDVNNILCIGHNLQIIIKIKIITLCWVRLNGWMEQRKGQIIFAHTYTFQLVKLFYANYFVFFHSFWCISYKQHVWVLLVFFLKHIICNNSIRDYRVRADKLPIRFNAASIRIDCSSCFYCCHAYKNIQPKKKPRERTFLLS